MAISGWMNTENVITHTQSYLTIKKMKLYYLHVEGSMPSELSQTKNKQTNKQTNTTWSHLYVDSKTKQKMLTDTKKRWGGWDWMKGQKVQTSSYRINKAMEYNV